MFVELVVYDDETSYSHYSLDCCSQGEMTLTELVFICFISLCGQNSRLKFIVRAIMSVVPFVIKHLVNRKLNAVNFVDESSFTNLPFDVSRKRVNNVLFSVFEFVEHFCVLYLNDYVVNVAGEFDLFILYLCLCPFIL
jgi:hypothetical protein